MALKAIALLFMVVLLVLIPIFMDPEVVPGKLTKESLAKFIVDVSQWWFNALVRIFEILKSSMPLTTIASIILSSIPPLFFGYLSYRKKNKNKEVQGNEEEK